MKRPVSYGPEDTAPPWLDHYGPDRCTHVQFGILVMVPDTLRASN